jgi:hypothetical protein
MAAERAISDGWIVSANRMLGINVVLGRIVVLLTEDQIPVAPWWRQ